MRETQQMPTERLAANAGIAIGPILFIIAILGILAAAIAAGSGSFTNGTASEGNSTKASALIQIGENLKVGMDRILMENGIALNNVVIGVNNTQNTNELFSPTGGGITIPATSMSNDPVNNFWYYPQAIVPNIGSGASSGLPDMMAMIQVSQGVCDQINAKAIGLNTSVANYDTGAIGDPGNSNNDLGNLFSSWPAALNGQLVGCVADSSTSTYWFYQVIAIQ
jgi:hypothetical protein